MKQAARAPGVDRSFPHRWNAEILFARPPILPVRRFVYPAQVEEVERGALEILIRPEADAQPFMATCALGFRDPSVPTGIWSCPNNEELCAVAGGYAYVLDVNAPERFTMIQFRPVLQVVLSRSSNQLFFVGHHSILAWGAKGMAWQSEKLSDEGVTIDRIDEGRLQGRGWNMMTDQETPFSLDWSTGRRA